MICVVVAMTSTASSDGSTHFAYDSGAFHPGSSRFQFGSTLV